MISMLISTMAVYMLVPLLIIAKRPKLRRKTITVIVILNSILGFFIFNIVRAIAGEPLSPNTTPAFFWGFLNHWILRNTCFIKDAPAKNSFGASAETTESIIVEGTSEDTAHDTIDEFECKVPATANSTMKKKKTHSTLLQILRWKNQY